jgi:hypothetical protein
VSSSHSAVNTLDLANGIVEQGKLILPHYNESIPISKSPEIYIVLLLYSAIREIRSKSIS